jgi:magnesium-protoporphyrin IX monomethyl ester (oxidative) cyclase
VKIFLIQPPNIVSETEARRMPPYLAVGLGTLAAVLRDEGHQVRLLDAYTEGWENRARIEGDWIEIGLPEEEIAALIRRFRPQVVGFSVPFTSQMPRLRSLARWVKAIHPEIFVICGGNHPSCVPEEVLAIPEVDVVIQGEADRTLPQLLSALEEAKSFASLPGAAFRGDSGSVIANSPAIITDLDTLPLPAYDLLPLKKYFKAAGGRKIPIFASRGCGIPCAAYSSISTSSESVRAFSPDYLCQAMRHLVEFYGVREFYFDDDGLFYQAENARRFLDRLRVENLRASWSARGGVRPAILDDELLRLMRLAGGRNLNIAVGSGSRRVLSTILKKKLDLYLLEEAVSRAIAIDFQISCDFLLGLPGETVEEVFETLNFAWKLRSRGVEDFSFEFSIPYVGTELRRQALALGCVLPPSNPDFPPHHYMIPASDNAAMEIAQIRDTAQREFSSRGLVIELGRLVGVGVPPAARVEERIFSSVAPWPAIFGSRTRSRLSETASREPA